MTRGQVGQGRFRARKLPPKHQLTVLREDQIEADEYKELLETQNDMENGVEKSEANEYHLVEALAAGLGRGSNEEAKRIVPAPPAEETKDFNYDEFYPLVFPKTSSYIRFSQTVEECIGCRYDMTTDDDTYLKSFNQKRPSSAQLSEDDFEKIMEIFESTAERQAPFAAVDNTVVGYDVMIFALKQDIDEKVQTFAKDIYEYWKSRRQGSGNKPLQPSLKFEVHQDSDETDPYVCFRRRDVRQTRKTRARDIQSTEKLRRLRKELEEGRQLVQLGYQRETAKREQVAIDRSIFEQRAKVKEIRQRLGIKVDDEDLINQKPQKRKPSEIPQLQRTQGSIRLPTRPDGRVLDADLIPLADIIAQKENIYRGELEQKYQIHQRWNQNHIDTTREPLSPIRGQASDPSFRLAMTHNLLTPPPTASDESPGGHISPSQESQGFRFAAKEDDESKAEIGYRRRIGRLGRLFIDRRGGLASPIEMDEEVAHRWKYDQDDDDEPVVYEFDPNDTNALRFRSTIPYGANFFSRRNQQDLPIISSQVANGSAGSPPARPPSSSSIAAHQNT